MIHDIKKRREIFKLGQRVVDYYTTTGRCVFCNADDDLEIPHDEHCTVGELVGKVERAPEDREKSIKFLSDFIQDVLTKE